jgi:hypothetical protein
VSNLKELSHYNTTQSIDDDTLLQEKRLLSDLDDIAPVEPVNTEVSIITSKDRSKRAQKRQVAHLNSMQQDYEALISELTQEIAALRREVFDNMRGSGTTITITTSNNVCCIIVATFERGIQRRYITYD